MATLAPVAGNKLGSKGKNPAKANATSFRPGPDARRPHEKLAEEVPPRVEVEGSGLLRALRSVLANHPKRDEGPEEKAARDWLKKDVQKFLLKKEELESSERLGSRVEVEEDGQEDRVVGLLADLLLQVKKDVESVGEVSGSG